MRLRNLPKVSFAERSPAIIESNIIRIVESLLYRKLGRADPLWLFLLGLEAIIIQQRELIDHTAKMNLLAYATGDYLDHIGVLVGTERIGAAAARTTLKLVLSSVRETAVTIPKGIRVTAGDGVMFALDETVVIQKGKREATGRATCTVKGAVGNGYAIGELKTIVDPVPFLMSAANITKTEGGADIESDESYRERIHEAPEKFSTAGSTLAYEYHAKAASALIADVSVDSPAPGEVVVYPLLKNGGIPGGEILSLVSEKLNACTVRPLTDRVQVKAPEIVQYDIDVIYYIEQDDRAEASAIQERTKNAVQEFVLWQKERLGT